MQNKLVQATALRAAPDLDVGEMNYLGEFFWMTAILSGALFLLFLFSSGIRRRISVGLALIAVFSGFVFTCLKIDEYHSLMTDGPRLTTKDEILDTLGKPTHAETLWVEDMNGNEVEMEQLDYILDTPIYRTEIFFGLYMDRVQVGGTIRDDVTAIKIF